MHLPKGNQIEDTTGKDEKYCNDTHHQSTNP